MNRLIGRNTIKGLLSNVNLKSTTRICGALRGYADGFTVISPDVPSDNASNNYMLNLPKQGELIDFQKVDPHQSFRAVLKTLFELEGCFEELNALDIDELKANNKLNFDFIYNEIDRDLAQLNYAYSVFQMMNNFAKERFTLRKHGNQKLIKAYNQIRTSAYKSKTIFKIMIELSKSDKLTDQQRNICNRYITEGKLTGLHLKTDLVVEQIKSLIVKYEENYIDNILTNSSKWQLKVINADYCKKLPNHLKSFSDGNVVNLVLNPVIYNHFMTNCDDQHSRQEFWNAYNNRAATMTSPRTTSNNILIDDILIQRRRLADYLGFINYIEYTLQTRTLDSILSIKDMIERLFEQTRNCYHQDLEQIVKFSASDKNFKSRFLNLWDLPFFTNEIRNQSLIPASKDLNYYFPVSKVIDGIFKFLSTNLDVKFEKVTDERLTFNQPLGDTLKYYRVYHGGEFVGSLYMNLYSKISQPQVRVITDRCDQLDVKPNIAILLNYDKLVVEQKLTLNFLEVASLFRSFGLVIDHLLPKNKYAEISGINSINKDFKDLTSNLLTMFVFHDYDVIKECSEHVVSGEQLPKDKFDDFVNAYLKFKSISLNEQIYRSALDFALYTQNNAWIDTTREVFDKYMSPFTFGNENFSMCSDVELLNGTNVGAYYCRLYSQILAADLFMLTHDNQAKNQSRSDLLKAYVNNFLLNENGVNNLNAFRKIRGRDFSMLPFLKLNQFINVQNQNLDKVKISST